MLLSSGMPASWNAPGRGIVFQSAMLRSVSAQVLPVEPGSYFAYQVATFCANTLGLVRACSCASTAAWKSGSFFKASALVQACAGVPPHSDTIRPTGTPRAFRRSRPKK